MTTLRLEGARATRGIDLDSLERFIDKFRDALRDYERSESAREYQIGRGGHPDARSIAATSFRLVGYKIGSAILDIEDAMDESDKKVFRIPTEGSATQNLRSLLDAVDAGSLDPAVTEDLDEARRALGDDGSFKVKVPRRRKQTLINEQKIKRLREQRSERPAPKPVTVFGRLHLIATEGTQIQIRATDSYNWICTYPPELEQTIFHLIKQQVRADGMGVRERANRGTLHITNIEPLPQYEQTPLFTFTMVPSDELERDQGIRGPQGLTNLGLSDLSDEEIDRYLSAIHED